MRVLSNARAPHPCPAIAQTQVSLCAHVKRANQWQQTRPIIDLMRQGTHVRRHVVVATTLVTRPAAVPRITPYKVGKTPNAKHAHRCVIQTYFKIRVHYASFKHSLENRTRTCLMVL